MTTFTNSAASRETSPELMEAIRSVAGSDAAAARVWEEPTQEEALAIWETATKNGLFDSTEYTWGAAGTAWAASFGIDG